MTQYEKAVALWQDKKIDTDAAMAEALNSYGIAFAYHSGKLENPNVTYHDTREIFDHDGVSAYTGDLRTLFEIRNARDAYEAFLTAFQNKRRVDTVLVKEFHRLLTQNTYDTRRWQLGERPGTYKKHDYATGKEEIGAPPEDVEEEMTELMENLADFPSEKALTAAAFFHVKFENIHPFADGNGRTGRLVMNYLLVLHGHPPLIVHEEDRRAYFDALEAWDVSQNLQPMLTFLQEQTAKTWRKQIERAEMRDS
ncbi:MAG: Fic family protein [Clostridia bacterium]|nr:Fic family protein [Clostridia bacterium]